MRGEARERSSGGIEQPHIAIVRPGVAASLPRRASTLKENECSVGRAAGRAAEGIVYTLRRGICAVGDIDGNCVGAHRAIEIALQIRLDECHRLPAPHANGTKGEACVEIRQLPELRAVEPHGPQIAQSITIALEDDSRAVERECGTCVIRSARRQSNGFTPRRCRAPKVAAPREHHNRSIGRERREPGKRHIGGSCICRGHVESDRSREKADEAKCAKKWAAARGWLGHLMFSTKRCSSQVGSQAATRSHRPSRTTRGSRTAIQVPTSQATRRSLRPTASCLDSSANTPTVSRYAPYRGDLERRAHARFRLDVSNPRFKPASQTRLPDPHLKPAMRHSRAPFADRLCRSCGRVRRKRGSSHNLAPL